MLDFFHFFRDFCTSLLCSFNDNGKLFENSSGMYKFQKKVLNFREKIVF